MRKSEFLFGRERMREGELLVWGKEVRTRD